MRIAVEDGRCEGHGQCAQAAPDVFELDEHDEVSVRHDPVAPGLQTQAEAGVWACPVAALSIIRAVSEDRQP